MKLDVKIVAAMKGGTNRLYPTADTSIMALPWQRNKGSGSAHLFFFPQTQSVRFRPPFSNVACVHASNMNGEVIFLSGCVEWIGFSLWLLDFYDDLTKNLKRGKESFRIFSPKLAFMYITLVFIHSWHLISLTIRRAL